MATIQAFLDARAAALPRIARQRREARRFKDESQDDYSFGIDFSAVDLAELGGEAGAMDDPTDSRDEEFAQVRPPTVRDSVVLNRDRSDHQDRHFATNLPLTIRHAACSGRRDSIDRSHVRATDLHRQAHKMLVRLC